MKLTTKREELVAKLSIVSRAVSTRAATQALSGVLLTAAEGPRSPLPPPISTWGWRRRSPAEVESEGSVLLPGRLLAEVARSLADQDGRRSSRARPSTTSRSAAAAPASTCASCPPRTSRSCRRPARSRAEDPGRGARRQHRSGRPRRFARRHAPGPHRRPRHRQRLGDDDGRHRLLPAGGQADRARDRARRRDRGQHPGPRPARARPHPHRRGGRGGRRSSCSPTRRFSRQGRSSSPRG